jgi:hypothetical protein
MPEANRILGTSPSVNPNACGQPGSMKPPSESPAAAASRWAWGSSPAAPGGSDRSPSAGLRAAQSETPQHPGPQSSQWSLHRPLGLRHLLARDAKLHARRLADRSCHAGNGTAAPVGRALHDTVSAAILGPDSPRATPAGESWRVCPCARTRDETGSLGSRRFCCPTRHRYYAPPTPCTASTSTSAWAL